jgi:hypothetical protein
MAGVFGKVLVLFAITLLLANAGCFARCIAQSCQDSPPSCHSHGKGDAGYCPQQNQIKTVVAGAVTFHLDSGFILLNWPAEVTRADQPDSVAIPLVTPEWSAPAPLLALRIRHIH